MKKLKNERSCWQSGNQTTIIE